MSEAGLVIVGAGHAGISAALAARGTGYSGTVTIIADDGAEMPYERPPLSKWSGDGFMTKPIYPLDQIEAANLKQIHAEITALDPITKSITLADGNTVLYSRMLLATGASARRLAQVDAGDAEVFYLRTKSDAEALKRACGTAGKAVIIGAGFIGLELAASLRNEGIYVQVLEAAERLLSRAVSQPVAQIVQNLHRSNGVTFRLDAKMTGIQKSESETTVCLKDGSKIRSDFIIAGVGSIPRTEIAQKAGLTVDNGIIADTHLQTSHPDIFVAGDCCRFPLYGNPDLLTRLESWQAAREQGELAGRNMASPDNKFETCRLTPWFWSEQYNHVLQVAGIMRPGDRMIERTYGPDHHITFGVSSEGNLSFACGIAPGTKIAKDIRMATKCIEAGALVTEAELSDTSVSLKSLLRR